jgi:AmpD protein
MRLDEAGMLEGAECIPSPNCDDRPDGVEIDLIVIHNISLPPGEFGGRGVIELFTNTLDDAEHPFYASIANLRVSSHFYIDRTGKIFQFVPTKMRAWHAGLSQWHGRERCNDFSIGIELEGTDLLPFADEQYESLANLSLAILEKHPMCGLAGHSDIAPGRKTDPGRFFDWNRYRFSIGKLSS